MTDDKNIIKYIKQLEKLSIAPLATTAQILIFKKNVQALQGNEDTFAKSLFWIYNNRDEDTLSNLLSRLSTRFMIYLEGLRGSFTRLANYINANNELLQNDLIKEVDRYIAEVIQQESIKVAQILDVLEKVSLLIVDHLSEQLDDEDTENNLKDK